MCIRDRLSSFPFEKQPTPPFSQIIEREILQHLQQFEKRPNLILGRPFQVRKSELELVLSKLKGDKDHRLSQFLTQEIIYLSADPVKGVRDEAAAIIQHLVERNIFYVNKEFCEKAFSIFLHNIVREEGHERAHLFTKVNTHLLFQHKRDIDSTIFLEFFDDKNPRVIIQALRLAIFLADKLDFIVPFKYLQPLLPKIVELTNHSEGSVREEAIRALTDSYKFVGGVINEYVSSMRPSIFKRLQEKIDELSVNGHDFITNSEAYALASPVDSLAKFDEKFFHILNRGGLSWKDRKNRLDELEAATQHFKLNGDRDYSHLVHGLIEALNSNNVNIKISVLNIFSNFVQGLRRNSAHYAKFIIPAVLHETRVLSKGVQAQCVHALEAFFDHVDPADISDEIEMLLNSKYAEVRHQTLCWVFRYVVRHRESRRREMVDFLKVIRCGLHHNVSYKEARVRQTSEQILKLMELLDELIQAPNFLRGFS
eukprot:TRINITY_DN11611_c0_g1_i5.p1 TRINITY_DN11611_c0_g1~~TRINITY_DN11611_c0_g1_i5.p1  ORF type:complete len:503 (-),score=150.45 TRINITY_DN11611_c0_g1_i5:20-1468(-)